MKKRFQDLADEKREMDASLYFILYSFNFVCAGVAIGCFCLTIPMMFLEMAGVLFPILRPNDYWAGQCVRASITSGIFLFLRIPLIFFMMRFRYAITPKKET